MTTYLDDLISKYAENKEKLEAFKKLTEAENKEIKFLMKSSGETEHISDEYKASYVVSTRESINEEMLLVVAHKYGIPVIKTKEYIDFDALENAIYNNRISNEVLLEMDKAKSKKEVVTLRITKLKRANND